MHAFIPHVCAACEHQILARTCMYAYIQHKRMHATRIAHKSNMHAHTMENARYKQIQKNHHVIIIVLSLGHVP
jgi:hypothetical protein